MLKILGGTLLNNLAESFVDNVIKTKVTPVEGSVLYCELVFDMASHTGIYVGDEMIVHLDGSGNIEMVTPKEFLNRLDGFNSAMSIYVSCKGDEPVGSKKIAQRAKEMAGKNLDYHLVLNNCHKFTAGCITGNFDSSDVLLQNVKQRALEELDANNWLVWDLPA